MIEKIFLKKNAKKFAHKKNSLYFCG